MLWRATPAAASVCVGMASCDQSADAAPIVIADEIVAVGPTTRRRFFGDALGPFIDVRVVQFVKSKRQPVSVRGWNETYGSDAKASFADLTPGVDVVLAGSDASRVAAT